MISKHKQLQKVRKWAQDKRGMTKQNEQLTIEILFCEN
jgi:hypothetical protein